MPLNDINTAFDLMHAGESIRSVVTFWYLHKFRYLQVPLPTPRCGTPVCKRPWRRSPQRLAAHTAATSVLVGRFHETDHMEW